MPISSKPIWTNSTVPTSEQRKVTHVVGEIAVSLTTNGVYRKRRFFSPALSHNFRPPGFCLTGTPIAALNGDSLLLGVGALEGVGHDRLAELARTANVFARVSPKDKLRIVEALVQSGEVIAVTGNGINDAPALNRASIESRWASAEPKRQKKHRMSCWQTITLPPS